MTITKDFEKYLGKAFVGACIYLAILIIGGFFIVPGVFGVEDYDFPGAVELFLKITATTAALIIFVSAAVLPVIRFFKKGGAPKGPLLLAALILLAGMAGALLLGLLAWLHSCHFGDTAWQCNVDGKSFVGLMVLSLFLAILAGTTAWMIKKIRAKR